MMTGSENEFFWIFILTTSASFLIFILVIIFLKIIFRDKLSIDNRLNKIFNINEQKNDRLTTKNKMGLKTANGILKKTKLFDVLKDELVLAGLMIKPDELIIIWIFSIFVPSLLAAFLGFGPIPALALIIIGLVLPPWFIQKSKKKHIEKFESQLSDALDIISNCLRSGLTFNQAIESISSEMADPIAREFKRLLREIQYGSTLENSLNNMSKRIKSNDLMLMVSAILIQRQVGGNLSQLLNNISGTIKERIKLKEEIKVITSTGRMSGTVIGLLPVAILLILMLINPGYIEMFFKTQIGIFMLVGAGIMETIGFIVVNKIVTVKY